MRVALFTETYFPSVNGVAAHVKTLRDGLEKLGHEVLVVTADKHCKHHYIEEGVLHCPAAEIKRFYGFGAAWPISHKRQRMIANFRPDVIHIHHEFGIGLSGVMAARSMEKPMVYTLHTMYDQYIFYIAPRPLQGAATKFSHKYEKFIAQNATALTGPSRKCDEYFKKIGVSREMNLIPNSADLDIFNPKNISREDKDRFLDKYGIPRDKTLAVFCGRLGKEKSVDVLLEYFGKTIKPEDNIHLVIAGEGPDKNALTLMAESIGIQHMVTFTGFVPHDQMPKCFAACDMYVTASLSEMNSISMLEAMASGLPVLQRYDELNADQIQTGTNGYLYNTMEELAQKMREIAALDGEGLANLKEQVIGTVVARGSTDLASYMVTVYEKAIEEKSAAPKAKKVRVRKRIRLR